MLTGTHVAIATADTGYAYAKIYGALERRRTAAVIPPKAEPIRSKVPMRHFRYDAKHDVLKCPRGKILKAGRAVKHGRFFTSRARDCRRCDMAALCLSGGRSNKAVVFGNDYPALLRARRRRSTGPNTTSIFIVAIAGALRVLMAKQKAGTASPAPSGAASATCRSAAAMNLKRLATALFTCLAAPA
jgi:hypothetical protein